MTLLLSLAPPASTAQVRLSDRLDGSAATALSAHTPDSGGPWTTHAGAAALNGSGAVVVSSTLVASAPCIVADVTVVAVVTETAIPRVIFRLTDASNYWYAQYDSGLEVLRIYEVVAGVPTQRASSTRTATGADRTLTVTVTGTSASVVIDGNPTPVSFTPMATGAGKTAHGIGGDAGAVIKDLVVTG